MKTDALNRRSRFAKPQPKDAFAEVTKRDLALFEAIDRHGKLPTNYLHFLTKHVEGAKDYKALQQRLTFLFNGYCDHPDHTAATPDGHVCRPKTFLSRDFEQFNTFNAHINPVVYGLTPLSLQALYERGLGCRLSPARTDPFVHQLMGACVSASLELECKRLGLEFIHSEDILANDKCPEATRKRRNPFALEAGIDAIIIPDHIFGIGYPEGGHRFFAVEIDRNNESIDPKKPVTNSIAKKVRGYSTILTNRTYRDALGIPNLTPLFITTNVTHMHRMLAHVKEATPEHARRFLFKAFPDFGELWRIPRDILPIFEPYLSSEGEVDLSDRPLRKKAPA